MSRYDIAIGKPCSEPAERSMGFIGMLRPTQTLSRELSLPLGVKQDSQLGVLDHLGLGLQGVKKGE